MATDKQGREYARVGDVKAGDVLEADSGFTCLSAGAKRTVQDTDGPWIACNDGRHRLSGQMEKGHYVGLYKVTT